MKAVLLTILALSSINCFSQRQYGVEDTSHKRRPVYAFAKDAIKIFPNPVVNDLYITVKTDSVSIKAVYLYDKDGNRLMEQRTGFMLSTPVKINMRDYPTGMYFIVVETNSFPFQAQVIKN